jgi:hypothetical protein
VAKRARPPIVDELHGARLRRIPAQLTTAADRDDRIRRALRRVVVRLELAITSGESVQMTVTPADLAAVADVCDLFQLAREAARVRALKAT